MGGAPWIVRIGRTRIDVAVNTQVYGAITDKATVEAAIDVMLDSGASKFCTLAYNGAPQFRAIGEIISKGPAMDSLCAELVGFDAQEILQREADQAAAKAARSAEKAAAKEEAADPRLLTALLGSEHLLNHACTAAFRRFDANG